jgi:hypothetical protein
MIEHVGNSAAVQTITGPAGSLEIRVDRPARPAPHGEQAVVLCHPHPQMGGTMDNKVVITLARAANDVGWSAVSFNFRGVGASAGGYDQGRGELEDARAVLEWTAGQWRSSQPALAGFSFGAWVAARLALDASVSRLLTVAPPVGRFVDFPERAPNCPWWIIQGLADEVVDARRVVAWAEQMVPLPRLVTLPGVSHFFHGHLAVLRDLARHFYQGKEGEI